MRSIGFSTYTDRKKIKELLTDIVRSSDEWAYTYNQDGIMLGEFRKSFTERIGITVCGEFDEEDKFTYDYYYPHLIGTGVTTYDDVSVERHAAKESYAGVSDNVNIGITIIFYLQNIIPYIKAQTIGRLPLRGTSLTFSALSIEGTIMMPIMKDEWQIKKEKSDSVKRTKLMTAARQGDEDAIETLTLEDMDIYTDISRRIQNEDVLSMVDTYFMPYGVECDHYSVLGEIIEMKLIRNSITDEEIYVLKICCNGLTFDVCINIIDLFGEPQIGRRFKGAIWLQGFINYPL
jgi:hypothetical protein